MTAGLNARRQASMIRKGLAMRNTTQPASQFSFTLIAALVSALCAGGAQAATADVLSLTVAQEYRYDDNVFRINDGATPQGGASRSDSIWTTRATAALDKESGRQRFTASLGGANVVYGDNTKLNHQTYSGQAGWRLGFGSGSEVGLSYNRAQSMGRFEDRTGSTDRNLVTSESFAADTALRIAGDWLGMASVSKGSFENSRTELRTGDSEVASADAGVRYAPRNGNYVDARFRKSEYDYNNIAPGASDPSYKQSEIRLTARWVPNGTSTIEPGFSLVRSKHDQITNFDYSGWTGFLNYQWKPTGALTTSLKLARDVGAVGDAWGSYAKTHTISSYTKWQTTAKLSFFLDAAWQKQSFEGFQNLNAVFVQGERDDKNWWLGIGTDYLVTDKLLFGLSVKEYRRMSSQQTYNYSDTQVLVTGQYKF